MYHPMRLSFLPLLLMWAVSPAIASAQQSAVPTPSAAQPSLPRYQTICFTSRSVALYQQPSQTSARIGTVQNSGGFTQLTLAEDSNGSDQWLHVVEAYVQGKRQSLSGYVLNDRVAAPTSASNAVHGCIVEPNFTTSTISAGKLPGNSGLPQRKKPAPPAPKPPNVAPPPSIATPPSLYVGCILNRSVPLYEKPNLRAKRIGTVTLPTLEDSLDIWEEPVELILAGDDDGTGQWLHINQVLRFSDYKVQPLSGYVLNDRIATPNNPSNAIERCSISSMRTTCTLEQEAIIYEKPNLSARQVNRTLIGEDGVTFVYDEPIYDGDRQWLYFDRVAGRVGKKTQIQSLTGYVLRDSASCLALSRSNSGRVQVRSKPVKLPKL